MSLKSEQCLEKKKYTCLNLLKLQERGHMLTKILGQIIYHRILDAERNCKVAQVNYFIFPMKWMKANVAGNSLVLGADTEFQCQGNYTPPALTCYYFCPIMPSEGSFSTILKCSLPITIASENECYILSFLNVMNVDF